MEERVPLNLELREYERKAGANDGLQWLNKSSDEAENEENKLQHVNILIAGKSGAGKSTLINAAFRADLAQTGMGCPVTKEIQLIENQVFQLKFMIPLGLS